MSDSGKIQKEDTFVDGLDMKGVESKGTARWPLWTTGRTNCHLLLWGRLGKDWVWGEDKKLRSGEVIFELSVRHPLEMLDRQVDTEMWDS